jgi:hypothetical protein
MSDKLTALTELSATPAYDDWFYVVDKSDTTDDAAGSSKKIAIQNVGRTLIETITNGSAGEFDFTSIPAVFSRLILQGDVRGDVTATSDFMFLLFNEEDTDADYHSQYVANITGVADVSKDDTPEIGVCPGASSPANSYGKITIVIDNYTDGHIKQATGDFNALRAATDVHSGLCYLNHDSLTAAITRLRLRTDNHDTDQLFGVVSLYGEI